MRKTTADALYAWLDDRLPVLTEIPADGFTAAKMAEDRGLGISATRRMIGRGLREGRIEKFANLRGSRGYTSVFRMVKAT